MNDEPPRLERRHIETVLAVAQRGSVHAAARHMRLPQPAVTKLLQDAERVVGRPLFLRSHRGCSALPDASDVLAGVLYAAKALASLDEVNRKGEVRLVLGCSPRASHSLIPLLLDELRDLQSSLRVSIIEARPATLGSLLAAGELDCVINRHIDEVAAHSEDYVIESLYQEETVLFAAADHPLAKKRAVSAPDLLHYPWVLTRAGSYSRKVWTDLLARQGLQPPEVVFESVSFLSSMHMAAQTRCISIAPERAVSRFEGLGLLKRLRTRLDFGTSMNFIAYHASVADRPGFGTFRSALHAAVARLQPP